MSDFQSTTDEKVPIFINPKASSGKDAELDEPAILSITAGNATSSQATPEQIADYESRGEKGLVGFVISEDVPGTSSWQVSGDADLGEGVETIVDGGTYTYNHPKAASLGATAGTPVPKIAA